MTNGLRETHYELVRRHKLSSQQRRDLKELEAFNLRADYPDVIEKPQQIHYYLKQSEAARQNLNKAVGGPLLWRRQQSYSSPLGILATNASGELCAYLSVANNASSRQAGLGGWLERQEKLHAPRERFVAHRYLWLGNVVMNGEVREAIKSDPHAANAVDVMIALAAYEYDPRQPASAYTTSNEYALNLELNSIGLTVDPYEALTPEHMFGLDADPVLLRHWRGKALGSIVEQIMEKPGADDAIADARVEIGVDTWGRFFR